MNESVLRILGRVPVGRSTVLIGCAFLLISFASPAGFASSPTQVSKTPLGSGKTYPLIQSVSTAPSTPSRPAALRALDIAVGRWIFHGRTLKTAFSKPGIWTWRADCLWSVPDRRFLECTFDNVWNGRTVRSLVVDTYNTRDHCYWHYEIFEAGAGGGHPFASHLSIAGRTWIESSGGGRSRTGIRQRIIYRYRSFTRVSVVIELSRNGRRWVIVDRGQGVRTGR